MPTSPAPDGKSGPTNAETRAPTTNGGAQKSCGGSEIRSQPAEGQQQRPTEKRARDNDEEDLTGVVVRIGAGAQPKTLARLRSTEPPRAGEASNRELSEARRRAPDEANDDHPVAVHEGGTAVVGRDGRVLTTQERDGRRPGRIPTGQRDSNEGRDYYRQGPSRTRRGPKKTAYQRRYAASRPAGYHAQLNPWDLVPIDVRSSASGQERAIFRARGLLVSHFDFQLYRVLYTFNVGLIPTVFPTAPQWWPTDWRSIPIALPWEVSLHRSELVRADPEDPLWKEVFQKFLEQLAGGWDLYYNQASDKSSLVGLSLGLAKALIDSGAFAFCSGRSPSQSFRKFCELHSFTVEGLPDQRVAKNSAWQRIAALRKERKEAEEKNEATAGMLACDCRDRMVRGARRLGLEAQTLEVVARGPPMDATETVERLCSLASAAMTYSIDIARLLERVQEQLATARQHSYNRDLEDAHVAIRNAEPLSEFLPKRFAANLSRVGPGS